MKSKAAFVRSLPDNTPAKEVVAKAKAAGMSLNAAYVYNVRATTKSSSKRAARGAGRGGGGHARAEELLRAIAAEIGLPRALEILEAERRRVQRLLA